LAMKLTVNLILKYNQNGNYDFF